MAWHETTMSRYLKQQSGTHLDGYSPGGVCQLLGVSRQRVHQLVDADKLDAYRIHDRLGNLAAIIITDESLSRLAAERGLSIPGLRRKAS